MDAKRRRLRRQQLDRQFASIQEVVPSLAPPRNGWVRVIREALGMNLESLGSRLKVSRQSAHQLEEAEVNGSISLKRLRAAADALNCDLIVALVPRAPLGQMLEERAIEVAKDRIERVGHTMAMEAQPVDPDQLERMVQDAARELVEQGDRSLWA